ncbi:putative acetyltransferase involved in intracellular survival [Anaerohalosphaera lusitana]|uniref:Putative acetyltransferase involved in intracellular survival n=1 Tax=Anaerohalosphaera lusitana TaxID=1936003 RepID=A0A1U9NIR2_9BACT|nr:GNAT family N-acetyltransferase [Anaerohalosphaera lusitana]AQT67396.1 putative acetyltransferase involved in intracellular survival [Anaerohalosphaera lusitana]
MTEEINIYRENDMPADIDARIRQYLADAFPHRHDDFLRSRTLRRNVPFYTVVLEIDGDPVAHVQVMDRTIDVGGAPVNVAGIGNVYVAPAHRGKGYSDRVMRVAMEEADRLGFDFGMLFVITPIKKVYERTGWIEISPRKFMHIHQGEELEVPTERHRMFYPLKSKEFPPGDVNLQGDRW